MGRFGSGEKGYSVESGICRSWGYGLVRKRRVRGRDTRSLNSKT